MKPLRGSVGRGRLRRRSEMNVVCLICKAEKDLAEFVLIEHPPAIQCPECKIVRRIQAAYPEWKKIYDKAVADFYARKALEEKANDPI